MKHSPLAGLCLASAAASILVAAPERDEPLEWADLVRPRKRKVLAGYHRHPADPVKKAARKRQKKARAITRRAL